MIELMIAVSILGITCVTLGSAMHTYQDAANRAYRIEGLARVLDVEMERFRACTDVRCVHALAALSPEAETWVGARVQRTIKPGPEGTLEIELTATAERMPPQTLSGLVAVKR